MPSVRRPSVNRLFSALALILAASVAMAALVPRSAAAKEPTVDELIELIGTKPRGMDRGSWKEERRDAARKLGRLGDKRAVPVLIEIVETEDFDAIAEIAIEALGKLGDDSAIPALQAVHADKSRDRYVRNLAAKALSQLGVKPKVEVGDDDDDDDDSTAPGPGTDKPGDKASGQLPAGGDDIVATTEHLTFAVGALSLQYDTLRDRPALDGNVSGSYARSVDRHSWAYRYGGEAAFAGGVLDYEGGDNSSRFVAFDSTLGADARFYLNDKPLYALVESALGIAITATNIDREGLDNDTREFLLGADLHVGIGGGYGRVIDIGAALRLRRIEQVLERSRMLGRPITPDLAERILRRWWSLRGEVGSHDRLTATVAMLREAGVLLGEPDASTSYKILQVLEDGQLNHRLRGIDVNLAVAESYLYRDDITPVEDGRIETLLVRARYATQSASANDELVGEASARYRILAEELDPTPWMAAAAASWRHYHYSKNSDPLGALELAGEVAIADDDVGTDAAARIAGRVGWIWVPNRASTLRAAASLAMESGEWFIGLSFEATYGLLDVGFVGASTYSSLAGTSAAPAQ